MRGHYVALDRKRYFHIICVREYGRRERKSDMQLKFLLRARRSVAAGQRGPKKVGLPRAHCYNIVRVQRHVHCIILPRNTKYIT